MKHSAALLTLLTATVAFAAPPDTAAYKAEIEAFQ